MEMLTAFCPFTHQGSEILIREMMCRHDKGRDMMFVDKRG
jgi:hypothetical protein